MVVLLCCIPAGNLSPPYKDLADLDGHMDLCRFLDLEHNRYVVEEAEEDIENLVDAYMIAWLRYCHFQMMVLFDGRLLHDARLLLVEVGTQTPCVREYYLVDMDRAHPEVLGTLTWLADR